MAERWIPVSDPPPPDDVHTWARPVPDACPDCVCCSARLCATGYERGLPCSYIGDSGPDVMDLHGCPCGALAAARRHLAAVVVTDPSHPDCVGERSAALDVEDLYRRRNGHLLAAARYLATAGIPVGVTRDDTDPHPVVLTIELPGAGQVTWHLPDWADNYGLPPAAPWDGHDTATKYKRLAAWLNSSQAGDAQNRAAS